MELDIVIPIFLILFVLNQFPKINHLTSPKSSVWFILFKKNLRTVFENTRNTILMLFKNYYCYLNLMLKKKSNLSYFFDLKTVLENRPKIFTYMIYMRDISESSPEHKITDKTEDFLHQYPSRRPTDQLPERPYLSTQET